jgi:hypothetical protein
MVPVTFMMHGSFVDGSGGCCCSITLARVKLQSSLIFGASSLTHPIVECSSVRLVSWIRPATVQPNTVDFITSPDALRS